MSKKTPKRDYSSPEMSLDPELRPTSKFDATGIAKFRVAPEEDMGMQVLDNCAEEHIM